MLAYSIILFACAVIFLLLSISIYRGNIELVHAYHRAKVSDFANYAKAFGSAMGMITAALFLSGAIALLGDSSKIILTSLFVLFGGLLMGIIRMIRVQKQYNGGMF